MILNKRRKNIIQLFCSLIWEIPTVLFMKIILKGLYVQTSLEWLTVAMLLLETTERLAKTSEMAKE